MAAPRPAPRAHGLGAAARGSGRRVAVTARGIVWAGGVLVLTLGMLVVAYLAAGRRAALHDAQARTTLLARVLEDHATRSVDAAAVALAALGDSLGGAPGGGPNSGPNSRSNTEARSNPGQALGQALNQALAGLPLLRAVAVLDRQGQVLASTVPADVGLSLQLARLGPLPAAGHDRLGPFVRGRSLAALAPGAAADAPAGVGFVPMLRSLDGRANGWLLVGLINPDALANYQQQVVGDEGASALLATPDGLLLAATADMPGLPGQALPPLRAFEQLRAGREFGNWQGTGVGPHDQVVAWRAGRGRPFLVLVQAPTQHVLADWAQGAGLVGALAVAAAAGLLLMTAAAARGLAGREQAQADVAEREREMSLIVGSVQELIFRTDAQGRLVFLNPRWADMSPVPLAQAMWRPLAELVCPGSRQAATALFDAQGPVGQRSAQLTMGRPDCQRQFDFSVSPLTEAGVLIGFTGSAVDVTERLADRARLAEQLAFTELLFETAPLPVSMLDTRGCYVMVNQAWEEVTGRHRDTVLGLPARHFLPPEVAAFHDARDAQLLRDGGRLNYEATTVRRDGVRRDVVITKAVVPGAGGQPAGVLVAFMDVTESREAERAVREARDAAEEASRAKSEFIANISHELRTPLQSIIGFSELGQLRGRDTPKLAGMFGDIHASGQRMLALVNDLLDVAKIESTVGTFHLERTDLRPLVREVARELDPLLSGKHLRMALALGDLPLVAKVDPMRFQQVMRNVLANAIRFSPGGASIEVEGELTADNTLHLSVRDYGPGIPEAELEKIFEAFVQSSKTKDGSGGTGLGLAICRKIVEAQGGNIRAANAAGGGSVFHIHLPARGFAETHAADL